MRTRKTNSSSNFLSAAASQEFYTNDYNLVGIVNFPGLNLTNKVITQIKLKVTAAQAGYGAGTTKTVYVRESNYQAAAQSGITGGNYYGPALGTFTGSFYGNTTTTTLSGTLLTNLAAYLAEGNNTICLFNPSPSSSSQGYSYNYLQWDSCQIIVTYEEAASEPTTNPTSVVLGNAVTINTNRLSTSATHTIKYTFGGETQTIATNVTDSTPWTPPVALASQIPGSASGACTITCETYYNGVLTGTKTCSLTLTVPTSVVPTISGVTHSEAVAGLAAQFLAYVQGKSKLNVAITAAGAYGSTISTYRATLDNVTYSGATFTSGFLTFSGSKTLSATVTDSRGRTSAPFEVTIGVVAYTPPSISVFTAERCNSDGTAYQQDGEKVRVNITASASSVGAKNTMTCAVYSKLPSASEWTFVQNVAPTNYAVGKTNLLLSSTFSAMSSYNLKVVVTDYFTTSSPVSQTADVGTKVVMVDYYHDENAVAPAPTHGIAFGKVAEQAGLVDSAWPILAPSISLDTPLAIASGGLGSSTVAGMRNNLGVRFQTYYSVDQLGFTVGAATINAVFAAMPSHSAIQCQASEWASGQTPSAYGVIEIVKCAVAARSYCLCYGKMAGDGTFRQYLTSVGDAFDGTWRRVYDGSSLIPVAGGGTNAATPKDALTNLGIFYAATLPASGTDGQICLVPVS